MTGGWVRYGDETHKAILEDFIEPARKSGFGIHLKNLYNQYVYFIRWALWKVFEHESALGPGVVSFVTASSYLEGDTFVGVREHLRTICEHIDIIDLGGEGRGARKDENVFAIKTPVAIIIAWRKQKKNSNAPATARYSQIEGSRDDKLAKLTSITSAGDLDWREAPPALQDPFRPAALSKYTDWPLFTDLMPWQHSGIEMKRTWPQGPEVEVLRARWAAFINSDDKVALFRETRDRKVNLPYPSLFPGKPVLPPLEKAVVGDFHEPVRFGFRSFDRQYVIPDNRLGDYFRPPLWHSYSDRQLYVASSFALELSAGPAVTVASHVPDLHYFCNRGGKDIVPLYRDSVGRTPNIAPSITALLSELFGKSISAEDIVGYIYCLLGQPGYTTRFVKELGSREVRVPLTKAQEFFFRAAEFGKSLIWLHTYGERMAVKNRPVGAVPCGRAKCLNAVSDAEDCYPNEFRYDETRKELRVGDGIFGPVEPEVYDFEVSGFQVIKSWLGYRMKDRAGRKSSPLDNIRPRVWTRDFTRELLELLWVLEKTVEGYPKQKSLFEEILEGPLFNATDFPSVPAEAREAPAIPKKSSGGQNSIPFAD